MRSLRRSRPGPAQALLQGEAQGEAGDGLAPTRCTPPADTLPT